MSCQLQAAVGYAQSESLFDLLFGEWLSLKS